MAKHLSQKEIEGMTESVKRIMALPDDDPRKVPLRCLALENITTKYHYREISKRTRDDLMDILGYELLREE